MQQQLNYLLGQSLLKDKAGYLNPLTKRQGISASKD